MPAEGANQGQLPIPESVQETPWAEGEKEQDQPTTADRKAAKLTQGTLKALLKNLTLDSMKALHTKVEEALAKAKAVLENPKVSQAQVDEQVKLMEGMTCRVRESFVASFFWWNRSLKDEAGQGVF